MAKTVVAAGRISKGGSSNDTEYRFTILRDGQARTIQELVAPTNMPNQHRMVLGWLIARLVMEPIFNRIDRGKGK